MGFDRVSSPVFPPLVAGPHFPSCFLLVARFAQCLQVVEVVTPAAGNIFDVVNFEVLGVAAFYALVVVAF